VIWDTNKFVSESTMRIVLCVVKCGKVEVQEDRKTNDLNRGMKNFLVIGAMRI
jgi:hypothetical protein